MNIRKLLTASAVVLMVSLMVSIAACFGGGDTGESNDTPAQFDAMLKASPLYIAQNKTIADQAAQIATDESKIRGIALTGHVPGAPSAADVRFGRRTNAIARAVDNTDYGICPDMGQHVGPGLLDFDATTGNGTPTDEFKNCTGNKVAYNSETGAVATAKTIWFSQANCAGSRIEFEADGAYDRPTLQGGLVFKSPTDGSVLWVQPLPVGTMAQQMTSQSIYSSGACSNGSEAHPGYIPVANVTDGSDGSGVPDGGVPNSYIYN